MDRFQRFVCIVIGALLVIDGIVGPWTGWALILLGLVMLGVVTLPEVARLVRRPPDPWPRDENDAEQ